MPKHMHVAIDAVPAIVDWVDVVREAAYDSTMLPITPALERPGLFAAPNVLRLIAGSVERVS